MVRLDFPNFSETICRVHLYAETLQSLKLSIVDAALVPNFEETSLAEESIDVGDILAELPRPAG